MLPTFRAALQRNIGGRRLMSSNAFTQERDAVTHHAAGAADLWRKISIYVAIPALIIGSVNAWNLYSAHQEHLAHMEHNEDEDHPEYPYQNIRTKNFFWGNGDKTLFWNDSVNTHKDA
ncbi:hypothetical protein PYCC9005_005697 [Savitreella phatthalungensis]